MAKQSEDVPVKRDNDDTAFHPLMNLREDIDRMFDNFIDTWPSLKRWSDFKPFGTFTRSRFALSPNVDVSETEQGYEITADLPGMDAKNIEVTLTNNVLTLKGEKKQEREENKKDYYLRERISGTVQRTFTLPDDVDNEKIDTQFSKGVLTINLPKSAEAKAKVRNIEVKAA